MRGWPVKPVECTHTSQTGGNLPVVYKLMLTRGYEFRTAMDAILAIAPYDTRLLKWICEFRVYELTPNE